MNITEHSRKNLTEEEQNIITKAFDIIYKAKGYFVGDDLIIPDKAATVTLTSSTVTQTWKNNKYNATISLGLTMTPGEKLNDIISSYVINFIKDYYKEDGEELLTKTLAENSITINLYNDVTGVKITTFTPSSLENITFHLTFLKLFLEETNKSKDYGCHTTSNDEKRGKVLLKMAQDYFR